MLDRRILRRQRPPTQSAGIRATSFSVIRDDASTSRQIAHNDDFLNAGGVIGTTTLIIPPYNPGRLFEIIEQSNMIQQCIDAYVTNTVLTGWEVEPVQRGKEGNEGEIAELESFVDNANSEEDLKTVMEKVIRDREAVGFGFLEVIRDISGQLSLLRHCPALWTRLCPKHTKELLVEYSIARGRRVSTVQEYRKFRRYVQIINGKQVWFKEFGDTRRMDYSNGAFEGEDLFNAAFPATEIIHFKNASNDAYGVPRWINQLPSIIGSRESEEVNMRYFQDNTVPPMMLTVSNGRLTSQSYKELSRALNENDIGAKRQNKIMLIEAVGESDSLDGKGSSVDLKVEKLTDTRQSDGLFKEYDQSNMSKVRSSFRLPPITVGMSQDVNFATASTSAFVAESQVFAPARDGIDQILNKVIIAGSRGMGIKSVKLVSRTPSITSPEMVLKAITALNVVGAITPRAAQTMSNKVLQTEIPAYPKKGTEGYEEWMDKPIALSMKATTAVDGGGFDQDAQSLKDDATKKTEGSGDVSATRPKNGNQ